MIDMEIGVSIIQPFVFLLYRETVIIRFFCLTVNLFIMLKKIKQVLVELHIHIE